MTEYKYTVDGKEHTLVFNPDGKPRYKIDGKTATGVTTILGVISKPELQPWVARLCAQEAFVKAYEMPVEAFQQLYIDLKSFPKLSKKDAEALGERFPEFKLAISAHTKKSDDAKDIGTEAHADVERYIRFRMGETEAYVINPSTEHMVRPFIDWAEGRTTEKVKTYKYDKNSIEIAPKEVKFLRAEQSVFSLKYFYAGTFDFLCEIDGKQYICDFKTSTGIYGREYFYQTAAYRNALEELGWGKEIVGSIIIRSGKEGNDFEVRHSLAYQQDLISFIAAYTLYHEGFIAEEIINDLTAKAQALEQPH